MSCLWTIHDIYQPAIVIDELIVTRNNHNVAIINIHRCLNTVTTSVLSDCSEPENPGTEPGLGIILAGVVDW